MENKSSEFNTSEVLAEKTIELEENDTPETKTTASLMLAFFASKEMKVAALVLLIISIVLFALAALLILDVFALPLAVLTPMLFMIAGAITGAFGIGLGTTALVLNQDKTAEITTKLETPKATSNVTWIGRLFGYKDIVVTDTSNDILLESDNKSDNTLKV